MLGEVLCQQRHCILVRTPEINRIIGLSFDGEVTRFLTALQSSMTSTTSNKFWVNIPGAGVVVGKVMRGTILSQGCARDALVIEFE